MSKNAVNIPIDGILSVYGFSKFQQKFVVGM
jgi:hypothetical protein